MSPSWSDTTGLHDYYVQTHVKFGQIYTVPAEVISKFYVYDFFAHSKNINPALTSSIVDAVCQNVVHSSWKRGFTFLPWYSCLLGNFLPFIVFTPMVKFVVGDASKL